MVGDIVHRDVGPMSWFGTISVGKGVTYSADYCGDHRRLDTI